MHFIVISKLPEFTEDGEVVPGQCEPYTSGWRLRLIVDSREEVLLTGTYYELRRVQRRCVGKSPEEVRAVVAESALAAGAPPAKLPGPQESESTQILGVDDVRRAMLEMEASVNGDGGPARLEWVEFTERDGIHIASVKMAGQTVDADEFGRVLTAALRQTPRGLVIDLSAVDVASPALARSLRDLGEYARLENRRLMVVCPFEPLQKAALEASAGALRFAPDVEAALKAALPVEHLP